MTEQAEQKTDEEKETTQSETDEAEEKPKKKKIEIEKINSEKIRGRVIVIDPEKSEIAKNLKLDKKADYVKKKS